jgi:RimJ/RimL family protein N-acetyltransferase
MEAGIELVLRTPRLTMRHLRADDADAIFAVIGDPIAMQYFPRRYSYEDAVEWIERNLRRYQNDGHGIMAVVLSGTGEVIGDCGIVRQEVDGQSMLEVGYHLRRDHWGRGYATEAARACMDYAFRNLGADKIVSLIRPDNISSRRVAERNRMQAERQVIHAGLPHLLYVVTRENYAQA